MARDIHDYDSLKQAYDDLLMFKRFPGPVRSERVEEFVIQLKRDIREYIHPHRNMLVQVKAVGVV